MRAWLEQRLVSRWWLHRGLWAWALRDVSWGVGWLAGRRRRGFITSPPAALPVPVLVVGNVVAGGAGKTPIVLALSQRFLDRGLHIGVISRGAGRVGTQVQAVLPDANPRDVGDEPLLLAQRLKCPVYVGHDRAVAARTLLAAHPETQLLISDDGLQHHALSRTAEVIVFDERGIGNGWCLPAGPLREPWPRQANASVPEIWLTRASFPLDAHRISRRLAGYAIQADGTRQNLSDFGEQPIHAVAAIAQPQAFFDMLIASGIQLRSTESFPDHYHFDSYSLSKNSGTGDNASQIALLCTEKDAVKLWRTHPHAWAVPLAVEIPSSALQLIDEALGLQRPQSPPTLD